MTPTLPPASPARVARDKRVGSLVRRMAAVLALTGVTVAYDRTVETSHHREQIETLAAWRGSEVRQWLAGLQTQVRVLQGSPDWREAQLHGLESGDDAARDALLTRASDLVRYFGGHSVWLLDDQGAVLASDAATPEPVAATLRLAVDESLRGAVVRQTGLYPAALVPGAVWFDTVVPLMAPGQADRAVLVLRVDASVGLLGRRDLSTEPAANAWGTAMPAPETPIAALATTQLARVEGGRLFVDADREGRPLAASGSLLGRVVRGELPLRRAAAGEGADGQAVLGAVQRVPQTDWYVLVQVPQSALRGAMLAHTLWILAAGLAALLGVGGLAALRWRRPPTGQASLPPGLQGAVGEENPLRPAAAGTGAVPVVAEGTATPTAGSGAGAQAVSSAGAGSAGETVPSHHARAGDGPPVNDTDSARDPPGARPARLTEARQSAMPSVMQEALPVRDAGARLPQPVSPLSRSPAGVSVTHAGHRRSMAGARVLLVEDNFINQEVAREALVGAGIQVVVAGDGRQALEQLQEERFDLVLMDVQMPVMDGLEATRQLRRMPGLQHLPVLAMTASAYGEDRRACLAAGMDDHLLKPVDLGQLYDTLARWLPPAQPVDAVATLPQIDDTQVLQGVPGAAVPAAPPVIAEPAVVHGLNCAQALVNLAGREDVYHRVLARFLSHHGSLHEELPRWQAAGDGGSIQRAMHSLRGSSATVGADRLVQCAQAVEAALAAAGAGVRQPAGVAHPVEDGAVDGTVDKALAAVLQELLLVEDHIRSLLARDVEAGAPPAAAVHDPAAAAL